MVTPLRNLHRLLAEGFELQEISLAVQVAREARKLLAESKNNKSWDGFHAKVEATSRVFAMVTGLKRQPKSDSINQNHAKQLQLNGGNATKDNKYTTTTGMGMLPAMPMTIRKVQSSASTA